MKNQPWQMLNQRARVFFATDEISRLIHLLRETPVIAACEFGNSRRRQ